MASSIMHLAITCELLRRRRFRCPERLRFGAILPDACVRGNGHLKYAIPEKRQKTYDFAGFRRMFGRLMDRDELYLGYYLHLIQDNCFRHFLYEEHGWNPRLPGRVQQLYRDYALCNAHVIRTYQLHKDMTVPQDFEREPIHALGVFDPAGLVAALDGYFQPVEPGAARYFTNAMADGYIRRAADWCERELEAMDRGEPLMDGPAFAWRDPPEPQPDSV